MRELYDREKLAEALQDARQYTLSVYAHLDLDAVRFPYLHGVNPPLWELAHVAWFQEHWCLRWHAGAAGEDSFLPHADAMLNSARIAHAARWDLPALSLRVVHRYLQQVLDETLERLAAGPACDPYFPLLALFHEDMHAEALRMALQTLRLPGPPLPPLPPSAPEPLGARIVSFPGGEFQMGSRDDSGFVFDNERQAHTVSLQPFALAATTVTQGDYSRFVEAGGYFEPRWWSAPGWAWREQCAPTAPRDWIHRDGQWWLRRFDGMEPLDAQAALVHVNAFEAEAYAAFAGARLPTEAEWEYAACARLPEEGDRYPSGAAAGGSGTLNLDNQYGTPIASAALAHSDNRAGLRQLLGNVWEWTASAFLPYPGFEPGPYKEYSQPWFGDHRVLRGGSFATRSRLVHYRWRNFYTPERNDVFAGIRLAYPPR